MKIYKLQIDMSLVVSRFKKFKLYNYNLAYPIIFIDANDADEACYKCMHQFCSMILKQDDSKETVMLLKDALFDIRITKITEPK